MTPEENKRIIERNVVNTVGRLESSNVGEFLKGARIAIDKAAELYEPLLSDLRKEMELMRAQLEAERAERDSPDAALDCLWKPEGR